MKKQYMVFISVVFLFLSFALGAYIYKNLQAKKYDFMARENASTFVREHSQTLGSDDAKVYLVEFSDPACETCSAFHPFVKELMAANPGKIKLVVRYAPFHDGADYAVKILEAAKKQGKYWETLEVMFGFQRYWTRHHKVIPDMLWKLLPKAGLDLDKIRADMNDPKIEEIIRQDLSDAKALNVRKTPGYFVNGKPLQRFGHKQLKALIDSEIKETY